MIVNKLNEKEYNEKDYTIKVQDLCVKGFLIVLPLVIIGIVAYILIKGGSNEMREAPWTTYFLVMLPFIIGFVIHEALHAITLIIFSDNGRKSLYYGTDPDYLKPYIKTDEAITMGQYRIVKLLPLLITGIIPYIIAYIIGSFTLACASMFLIGMCGADIKLLLMSIKEKNSSYCKFDEYISGIKVYEINNK